MAKPVVALGARGLLGAFGGWALPGAAAFAGCRAWRWKGGRMGLCAAVHAKGGKTVEYGKLMAAECNHFPPLL